MNKQEIQKRVKSQGKPLSMDDFFWDERTKTFSSVESFLIIDFSGMDDLTLSINLGCSVKVGNKCTINSDEGCMFIAGDSCVFNCQKECYLQVGYGCCLYLEESCVINAKGACVCVHNHGGTLFHFGIPKGETIKLEDKYSHGYTKIKELETIDEEDQGVSLSLENYIELKFHFEGNR